MNLFSTEMVSKYHPDKYADRISDSILTAYLSKDPQAHVACECLAKGRTVIVAGEITSCLKSDERPDHESIARAVASESGYEIDRFIDLITPQSSQICNAVDSDEDVGAGDQGMMFGYACKGGKYYLPYGQEVAIDIIKAIENDIAGNPESILKGDAKTQVTTDLDAPGYVKPVDTILVSVCHREGFSLEQVKAYMTDLLEKAGIPKAGRLLINPAGVWTFGGPEADCGLTGRKIVCDQYGGYAPVGGGAFSGKDPSKVDRSACYMARRIAVDMVKEHDLSSCTVQLAYAIGKSAPVSVSAKGITDEGTETDLAPEVLAKYRLTPKAITEYLGLKKLDYSVISGGNHMMLFK